MRQVSVRPGDAAPVVSIDSGGHRARVLARRDALVETHLSLVPPIAAQIKRTLPACFELEDLIGAGNFGLVRAATRYRPQRHGDCPFSAFARPRIRGAILDSVRRKAWEEQARRGEMPENFEVAFRDPFDEEAAVAIDEERTLGRDRWGRRRKPLAIALSRLTARQRIVLGAYYAENSASVADAGNALGLSPAEVAREHDSAIASLRRLMHA